jgi:hypothetical protein
MADAPAAPTSPKTPLLKTALIYDFDGTLARGNMQEVSFIPSVGMDIGAFWEEAERLTKDADGDGILMYMQLMLHHARQNGSPVTRETLRQHGEAVALFEGLKDLSWFDRMNAFGARYGLEIEHYIVSAGLEEMIDGTPIRPALTHVFASHYVYDDKGRGRLARGRRQLHHQNPVSVPHQQGREEPLGARTHQPLHPRRRSAPCLSTG